MSVTSARSAGTKRRAVHGGSADKEPGARRALAGPAACLALRLPDRDAAVTVASQGDDLHDAVAFKPRQRDAVHHRQSSRRQAALPNPSPAAVPIAPEPEAATAIPNASADLSGGDHVAMTVTVDGRNGQGSARHRRSLSRLGQRRVELPISPPVSEIDLETRRAISEQEKIELPVPVDIDELGSHVSVVPPHEPFGEAALSIAEERLDAAEVARRDEIGKSIAIDIARGERGVADVPPRRRNGRQSAGAVTEPDVKRGLDESRRRDEIEVAIAVQIDDQRIKAPFRSGTQRADDAVHGKR